MIFTSELGHTILWRAFKTADIGKRWRSVARDVMSSPGFPHRAEFALDYCTRRPAVLAGQGGAATLRDQYSNDANLGDMSRCEPYRTSEPEVS